MAFAVARASSGVFRLEKSAAVWCTTIWLFFVLYPRARISDCPLTSLMIPSNRTCVGKVVVRWEFMILHLVGVVVVVSSSLSVVVVVVEFLKIMDWSVIQSARFMISTHGRFHSLGVYANMFPNICVHMAVDMNSFFVMFFMLMYDLILYIVMF